MLIDFAIFYLAVGLYTDLLQIYFSYKEGYLPSCPAHDLIVGMLVGLFVWPLLVYEWIRNNA